MYSVKVRLGSKVSPSQFNEPGAQISIFNSLNIPTCTMIALNSKIKQNLQITFIASSRSFALQS